jgi:gentisate 1,2-dioxygenase
MAMSATTTDGPAFDAASDLDELHRMLDLVGMRNGWSKPKPSIYPEPHRKFLPAHWRYVDARSALHAAGRLVSPEWAERRNLIMANPIEGNDYPTVPALVGAYQMVKPNETARSHRHTPNAMRIVLEASPGAYTIVDGKRIPMRAGDVLLTPNWSFHGHSNDSREEAYWIDILDAPLVHSLGPMFFEVHPEGVQRASEIAEQSPFRFAFRDYKASLLAAPEIHPNVRSLQLGPGAIPTFDRVALHLSASARWERPRTTVSRIYAAVEGTGAVEGPDYSFRWERGDLFVVPSWIDSRLEASADSLLIQISDEPLLHLLGWNREGAT